MGNWWITFGIIAIIILAIFGIYHFVVYIQAKNRKKKLIKKMFLVDSPKFVFENGDKVLQKFSSDEIIFVDKNWKEIKKSDNGKKDMLFFINTTTGLRIRNHE